MVGRSRVREEREENEERAEDRDQDLAEVAKAKEIVVGNAINTNLIMS
jgi:hypothetical protein